MIRVALEKLHCTPEEALRRVSAEGWSEIIAHYELEHEDAERRRALHGQ